MVNFDEINPAHELVLEQRIERAHEFTYSGNLIDLVDSDNIDQLDLFAIHGVACIDEIITYIEWK
jgi:hypothetical protein